MRHKLLLMFLLVVGLGGLSLPAAAQSNTEDAPVVRAVFFFSPTCSHCELVLNDHLPGIYDQYGGEPTVTFDPTLPRQDVAFFVMSNGTLELLIVDVTVEAGGEMFVADSDRLGIPEPGVPRLDIADVYLVGSVDIPAELPGLIERGLAAGGVPWPDVPGIEAALAGIPGSGGETAESLPAEAEETVGDRFGRDPLGNSLAVAVLLGMVASLVLVPLMLRRETLGTAPIWLIPVLALVGMGISIYLGSVEASGSDAICGPVGDCNAVQQSEYASLFGVPIGILGLIGYAGLLISWIVAYATDGRVSRWGAVIAGSIAFGGTLFSIYLTFLEPFVIGATCMWCLASALCITGLFWSTARPAWSAFGDLRASSS